MSCYLEESAAACVDVHIRSLQLRVQQHQMLATAGTWFNIAHM